MYRFFFKENSIKIIQILFFLLVICKGYSQSKYSDKFIHNTGYNKLKINIEKTKAIQFNRFKPIKKTVTAYSNEGKPFKLHKLNIVRLMYVRSGKWLGYNGDWLEFNDHFVNAPSSLEYYIPMKYMKDIEATLTLNEQKTKAIYDTNSTPTSISVLMIVVISVIVVCVILFVSGGVNSNTTSGLYLSDSNYNPTYSANDQSENKGSAYVNTPGGGTSMQKTSDPTNFKDAWGQHWKQEHPMASAKKDNRYF